jgi:hypothetical protein
LHLSISSFLSTLRFIFFGTHRCNKKVIAEGKIFSLCLISAMLSNT